MSNANLRDFLEIKQHRMEPFELFVKRLKDQAKICRFSDPARMIKDQIIEQCFLNKLKRKAAEIEMTLDELISTGIKLGERYTTTKEVETQCTRCGCKQHTSFYNRCPALVTQCLNCKNMGHFTTLCKFLNQRKRPDVSCSQDVYSKRAKNDWTVEVPMLERDRNGESSKVENGCSGKLSTSYGVNVT